MPGFNHLSQIFVIISFVTVCGAGFAAEKSWLQLKNAGAKAEIFGDYVEAENEYKLALAEAQRLGPKSKEVAETCIRLATMYVLQNKFALAEPYYSKGVAIALEQKRAGHQSEDVITCLEDLVSAYESKARGGTAKYCYEHMLEIADQLFGPSYSKYPFLLNKLALIYYKERNLEKAEQLSERWLALSKDRLYPEILVKYSTALATMYYEDKKYAKAEELCKQALSKAVKYQGSQGNLALEIARLLTRTYIKQEKLAEANELSKHLLNVDGKKYGAGSRERAIDLWALALMEHHQGNYKKAEQSYRISLGIIDKTFGRLHQDPEELDDLAQLLRQTHRQSQGRKLESLAQVIRKRNQMDLSRPRAD